MFFVISGFVITGVLLRGATGTGRVAFANFYARRSRRIFPAAALVIIVTIIVSYSANGVIFGTAAAVGGRRASVFLANFHCAAVGSDYFTTRLPPSPFLNFWSLAVEEQLYVVHPALFLAVLAVRSRRPLEQRLFATLIVVIAASYAWSIAQIGSNPTVA